jgi:hypothetical protein
MCAKHLRHLIAYPDHRVKRRFRFLKDHRDLGATNLLEFTFVELQQICASKKNRAA